MNKIRKFLSPFLLIFAANLSLAAEKPFTDLELERDNNLFYELGLIYTPPGEAPIRSMAKFFDAKKSLESIEDSLPKDPSNKQLLSKRLNQSIKIRDFLLQMEAGVIDHDDRVKDTTKEISSLNSKITTYANQLYTLEKIRSKKLTLAFLANSFPPYSSKSLKIIKQISNDKNSPAEVKNRADYILLNNLLQFKKAISKPSMIKGLEKKYYKSTNKLTDYAKIASTVALAKAYAGIYRGKKIREIRSNKFTYLLKIAARKIVKLQDDLAETLGSELIEIWQTAKGGKENYLIPPFDFSLLRKTNLYHPIQERIALSYYRIGKLAKAKSIYYKLASEKEMIKFRVTILDRVLGWEKIDYSKTKSFDKFETEIKNQINLVSKNTGDEYSAYLLKILSTYKSLVLREIKTAKSSKSEKYRKSIIRLIDRYLDRTSPSDKDSSEMQFYAAEIHVELKDYKMAVSRFLKSSDINPSKIEKAKILSHAIKWQEVLAKWPSKPSWTTKPKAIKNEVIVLTKIYKQKNTLLDTFDWDDVAKEGLANIWLKNENITADTWTNFLQRSPTGPKASKAAYLTFSIYKTNKFWDKLEKISRFMSSRSVTPTFYSKKIDPEDYLAIALFEGGKENFGKGKFDVAVTKFKEYVNRFQRSNEDEAVFYLSKSLWNNKNYREAIEESVKIVKDFKKSKYFDSACLLGFDWSRSVALESTTAFFVEKYTAKHQDDKAYGMRHLGVRLYLGLEKYVDAMRHITELIKMKQSTPNAKKALVENLLDISYRYGSLSSASKIADELIKLKPSQSSFAKALFIKAKLAHSNEDIKSLRAYDQIISQLKLNDDSVRFAQASIKNFILNSTITDGQFEKVHNTSLVNPLQYIKDSLVKSESLFLKYKSVCDVGPTTVCPEAMNKFENYALKILENVDEVKINDTLDDSTVSAFDTEKDKIRSQIKDKINTSFQIAYSVTSKGTVLPETNQETLWRRGLDWNFEPISTSPGSGYIRWRMKADE